MTNDQINEKVLRMVDHLDRLRDAGVMTRQAYNEAMEDLGRWAASKRALKVLPRK
jgi:hypothetical protein